jgi:hypothetical protein
MRPDQDGDHQLRLLEAAWDQARQHWHDDMARNFEARHWTPLTQECRTYLDGLRALMEVLEAAQREMEMEI